MTAWPDIFVRACLGRARATVPACLRHWHGGCRIPAIAFASLLVLLQAGCTRTMAERGVEPLWRSVPAGVLVRGVTTKAEILEHLGPPSQVITEGGGEIFYYLHEETRTRGLVLVVYNKSETETRYDRAIFFFDADGILQEYSLSAVLEGDG